jgi:uncharacterized beta-barrel protein YwiB (DUF1934 family)
MENPIKAILMSQSEQNTLFDVETITDADNVRYIVIKDVKFLVFRDGDVFRNMFYIRGHTKFLSKPHWRRVRHNTNLRIKDGIIAMHRVIAHAWLEYDLNDKDSTVIHVDGNKDNYQVDNLKVLTEKPIYRNPNAKGCSYHKKAKAWEVKICFF